MAAGRGTQIFPVRHYFVLIILHTMDIGRFQDALKKWLGHEAHDKKKSFNADEWKYVQPRADTPQQRNGCDCGAFMTMFCDFLSDDLPLSFTQEDIFFFRMKIGTDILRGRLAYFA